MALTLEEANRMVQAGIAKAVELNVNMSIAVCDAGGSLLAFNRMPGASAVSAAVAQGKAAAAAGFGRPSGSLQADSPVIQSIISSLGGRMLPAQGAVPIRKGRRVGRLYWRKWRHGRAGRRLRQGGVGGPLAFTAPTAPSESAQSPKLPQPRRFVSRSIRLGHCISLPTDLAPMEDRG